MFFRSILLAVALVICIAGASSAQDWEFWGHVTYQNCDCTHATDQVEIKRVVTAETWYYGVDCWRLGYNCGTQSFPTGSYQLRIVADDEYCNKYYQVTQVYHTQGESQQVDLKIGPPGTPTGGDD